MIYEAIEDEINRRVEARIERKLAEWRAEHLRTARAKFSIDSISRLHSRVPVEELVKERLSRDMADLFLKDKIGTISVEPSGSFEEVFTWEITVVV